MLLIPITTRILIDTGVDLAVHPATPDSFARLEELRTAFYENVEAEGVVVEG